MELLILSTDGARNAFTIFNILWFLNSFLSNKIVLYYIFRNNARVQSNVFLYKIKKALAVVAIPIFEVSIEFPCKSLDRVKLPKTIILEFFAHSNKSFAFY